jgi:ABC-type microcin C transport system duplicated ATPase subunit YejF
VSFSDKEAARRAKEVVCAISFEFNTGELLALVEESELQAK